jgi:hypothetical protein
MFLMLTAVAIWIVCAGRERWPSGSGTKLHEQFLAIEAHGGDFLELRP